MLYRSKHRILNRGNSNVLETHKCSTLVAIREMKSKTALRFHFTLVRIAKINKTYVTVYAAKDVE